MSQPQVNPQNLYVKYNPPSLALSYSLKSNPGQSFIHRINIFLKDNPTTNEIVDELYREEEIYFKNISKEQVKRLVNRIIEVTSGKKIENLQKNKEKEVVVKGRQADINNEQANQESPSPDRKFDLNLKSESNKKSAQSSNEKEEGNDLLDMIKDEDNLRDHIVPSSTPKDEPKNEEKKIRREKPNKIAPKEQKEVKAKAKKQKKIDLDEDDDLFGKHDDLKKNNSSPKIEEIDDLDNFSPDQISGGKNKRGKNDDNKNNKRKNVFNEDQAYEGDEMPLDDKNEVDNQMEELDDGEEGTEDAPKLTRVFIEDLQKEFLMDSKGNVYDMEGFFVGKADNGPEDEEEEEGEDQEIDSESGKNKQQAILDDMDDEIDK